MIDRIRYVIEHWWYNLKPHRDCLFAGCIRPRGHLGSHIRMNGRHYRA